MTFVSVPAHAPLWAERLHVGGSDLGGPAYLLQLAVRGACAFRLGEDDLVYITRTGAAPDDDGYRAGLLDCFVGVEQTTEVELKDLGGGTMHQLRRTVEDDLVRGGYLNPDALRAPRRLRWWAVGWLTAFGALAATVQPVWLWAFMAVFGSAGLFVLGSVLSPSVVTPEGQSLQAELEAFAVPVTGVGAGGGDAGLAGQRSAGAERGGAQRARRDRSVSDLEDALPVSIVVSRQPEEWLRAFGRRVEHAGYRLAWLEYPSRLDAGEALSRLTRRLGESLRTTSPPRSVSRGPGAAAAVT
jgi:hypothetical protein